MSNLPSRKRPHPPDRNSSLEGGNGSNVKVVVRIRPQNVKEVEGNFRVVVQAVDENILVFDPKENNPNDFRGHKARRDIRKRQNRDLKFAFDRVFGPDAENGDIYKETTNSVIAGLLDGYNCSVFAYGATGAGKTFTMLGTKERPGVMYHTMMDLYSRIEGMKDNQTCDVAVSYLEVYNETIRDLLMPGSPLPIREDPGKGVVIPGLSLHKPKNAEELLYMLQFGNQHRSQHPTDANAESSRSHAVFQVFVRQQDRTANISTEVRVAKMCLVDLAGSERATVTKNRGSRFREGANINRSLLALGNVINALAENKNKGFVPYRDSKLTRLLKDSLGGNCQTVMIAAVSPSAMSFEDTYNTLRYADRAKNIKATLKKNVLNVDFHMAKYGQIVTELRKEIAELKSKLKSYEEGTISPVSLSVVPLPDMSSCNGFQNELDKFFKCHLSQRSDQVQQEITLRNLQWKLYRKRRCMARVKAINDEEGEQRLETVLKGMTQKSSCLSVSAEISRGKLEQNLSCFYDLERRMKANLEGEHVQKVMDLSLGGHTSRLELQDTRQYLSFTKQVIRYQERELDHNERLVLQVLRLLKNQHFILKGHNILTSDLEEEFKDIIKKVKGQEVTWEDKQEDVELHRSASLSEMLDLPTLKLKITPNNVNRPKPANEIPNNRNTSHSIWSSQPPTHNKSLPYTQVDECSPPKAKRRMLSHQSIQPPGRNDAPKVQPPHRNISSTNRSHLGRSKRSRSYSETTVTRNRFIQRDTKLTNSMPFRVSQNETDKESPDFDENQKSRFSKINDTITKAKKFSYLHTKSVNDNSDKVDTSVHMEKINKNSNNLCNKSDKLDGTFTVDDDDIVPVKLPCVHSHTGSVCQSCVHHQTPGSQASVDTTISQKLETQESTLALQSAQVVDSNSIKNTQNSQLVPSELNVTCDLEPDKGESCNDSNASTLVNQSSSSQTSVASTLVANLSQNLSNIEENDAPLVQKCDTNDSCRPTDILCRNESADSCCDKSGNKANEIDNKENNIDNKANEIDQFNSNQNGCSKNVPKVVGATVTKVQRRNSGSPQCSIRNPQQDKNTKAARCIKFGDKTDFGGTTYLINGRRSMTPDRRPLQKLGDSNTPPILSDRSSYGSSANSSDSDLSFDKSLNQERHSATRLFEKENSKMTSKFGLPLLSEGSLIINSMSKTKKLQSSTPGYMQATKAHNHRIKHNKSMKNDGDKLDNGPGRVRTSNSNRPLDSKMRSKSMSNLSSRSVWQI